MKKCQGQKASAVAQMAGEAWKKLGQNDKDVYQKQYEEAKAKFEKDMEAFKAAGGEVAKGIRAQRSEKRKEKEGKKKKDPNAPKRPQSAYSVFLSENREAILKSLPAGANPITDVAKKAGEQWKALSAAAKKPFEKKAEKQKAEYLKAMEEYKKTHGDDAADEDEEEEEPEEKPKKRARKAGA